MSFGLKEVHLEEIKTIFAKFNSITKVILYGSRAKGNYKTTSDIDMTIIDDGTFTFEDLLSVIGEFEESNLPYFLDINQYSKLTNKELMKHIDRVGITIYEKNY